MHLSSTPGVGSAFTIFFPQVENAGVVTSELHSTRSVAGSETILVVEDQPSLRDLVRKVLQQNGYSVIDARDGDEGVRFAIASTNPIHLVITDVVMPETDGRALGYLIAERYPEVPVAYMSAYPVNDIFHRGDQGPDLPFLSKPFSPDALLALVKTVVSDRAPPTGVARDTRLP